MISAAGLFELTWGIKSPIRDSYKFVTFSIRTERDLWNITLSIIVAARECHCRPLKYKDITNRNVQVRVRVVSYAKDHMTKCEFLAKTYRKASVSRSCLHSTHVLLDSGTIFRHLTSQCVFSIKGQHLCLHVRGLPAGCWTYSAYVLGHLEVPGDSSSSGSIPRLVSVGCVNSAVLLLITCDLYCPRTLLEDVGLYLTSYPCLAIFSFYPQLH